MPETDAELIRRAREDPDALGELYLRWNQPIFFWFRGRVPESDASELTAELFAQVALNLRRFRDEVGGSAGPWLYGIGKNLLRRYYERGRVEQEARRRLGMPIRSYEADFEEVENRLFADGSGSPPRSTRFQRDNGQRSSSACSRNVATRRSRLPSAVRRLLRACGS